MTAILDTLSNPWVLVLVVVAAWFGVGALVALFTGRAVRLRDQPYQAPADVQAWRDAHWPEVRR